MRVATALPSATEIVYALGVEPVAVSHECKYPSEAADRPRLNSCVVDPDGTSEDINEQLDAHDQIYEVDRDTLRETDPDIVITQAVCDVCAVDELLIRDAVEEMDLDCEVLTTDSHSLDDVLDEVLRIGDAIDRAEAAQDLVDDCRERITAVEKRAADAVAENGRPRCIVTDWMEPPMVAGHWTPEMVEFAGGQYGITEPEAYSVPEDWDDIVDFDPEVLIVSPCGFSIEHTLRDVDELQNLDGWSDISAVQDGRVYAMDGDILNCSSPRLVDALEHLAGLLHPGYFDAPPADAYADIPMRSRVEG